MDPVNFTGREILEMALRIEENGMRFYSDASKASKNKDVKELFRRLAEEEAHHIKVFTEMKKLMPGDTVAEGFDPYITEASLYLRAIADTEVFTEPGKGAGFAKEVGDEKEVLNLAIDMEKDSILFYYEFLKIVRDKDRAILDALIEQEKSHLSKLSSLRERLFGRSL